MSAIFEQIFAAREAYYARYNWYPTYLYVGHAEYIGIHSRPEYMQYCGQSSFDPDTDVCMGMVLVEVNLPSHLRCG